MHTVAVTPPTSRPASERRLIAARPSNPWIEREAAVHGARIADDKRAVLPHKKRRER